MRTRILGPLSALLIAVIATIGPAGPASAASMTAAIPDGNGGYRAVGWYDDDDNRICLYNFSSRPDRKVLVHLQFPSGKIVPNSTVMKSGGETSIYRPRCRLAAEIDRYTGLKARVVVYFINTAGSGPDRLLASNRSSFRYL